MKRRQVLSSLTAGTAGAALAACGSSNASDDRKPTFVFVHGAWHGAWCWAEIVHRLSKLGYPAVALDLPGHGTLARFPVAYHSTPPSPAALATERSPLASITLNDFRTTVADAINGLVANGSGRVILVGHSAGGIVLNAIGEAMPDAIRRMIYLTAFVPVRHSNLTDYIGEPALSTSLTSTLFAADPMAVGALRINFNSTDPAYIARVRAAFYGDADDGTFAAVGNLCTPDEPLQPSATSAAVTAARWGRVSRAYIRCTNDRSLTIAMADQMIADADALTPQNPFIQRTLVSDHSPFVTQPQALVDALVSLV